MAAEAFPGSAVRAGDARHEEVKLVQRALENAGLGPLTVDGIFGAGTRTAVQTFQLRRGLVSDGIVGAATWRALFPAAAPAEPEAPLAREVLRIAAGELGVREQGGPNRGPRVDEYLRNVGLDPTRGSYAWCASFVYFCLSRAAVQVGVKNPCIKTASCMDHWRRAPEAARMPIDDVRPEPSVVPAGAIFIVDHGQGKGHTGLVESVTPGAIHTIEGNTDPGGSREGDGVYRRIRPLATINVGFLDYYRPSRQPTARGDI